MMRVPGSFVHRQNNYFCNKYLELICRFNSAYSGNSNRCEGRKEGKKKKKLSQLFNDVVTRYKALNLLTYKHKDDDDNDEDDDAAASRDRMADVGSA